MAEQASLALPARTVSRDRLAGWSTTVVPFLIGGLITGILAADDGGYWPTAWGWTALVLTWVAALGLILRSGEISSLEVAFAGLLAGFTLWTALSLFWTTSATQTMLSVERTLVYVLGAIAAAAVLRAASYRSLVWGVWAGSAATCLYALLTRLLPDRLGSVDVVAGYRLSDPVGYWNGLGLLAAMAALLAVGFVAHGRGPTSRAVAAWTLPLVLAALYLTFSRGAWVALAAAMAFGIALSPRRVGFVFTLLLQALPSALAVWLVDRASALHVTTIPPAAAVHEGHRLLWQLPLVGLVAAGLAVAQSLVAGRFEVPRTARTVFAAVVSGIFLVAVAVGIAHYGGPEGVVHHARQSIQGSAPGGNDLNARLFSLSANGRLRQFRIALDEWRAHRAFGGGAGTYREYWAAAAPNQGQLINVHNLYLETLAELGPVGLGLLVAALLVPLVAAVRARQSSLVPVAATAYVAFLVHVAYDWDWQLTGVTIAALLCASAVLAAQRPLVRTFATPRVRYGLLALALATGVLSFFGLLGNLDLNHSGNALRTGNTAAAATAAKHARRWAPWSSQPWLQLAVVRAAAGDRAAARSAYREAVAKDPHDWQLWLGLASVSTGAERARALARMRVLHPESPA
jgi:hypothetical protein